MQQRDREIDRECLTFNDKFASLGIFFPDLYKAKSHQGEWTFMLEFSEINACFLDNKAFLLCVRGCLPGLRAMQLLSHSEHLSPWTLKAFITQVLQKPCLNRIA